MDWNPFLQDALERYVQQEHHERLRSRLTRDRSTPIGAGHVAIISEALRANIAVRRERQLDAAYSFGIAAAFLLDDLADAQTESRQAIDYGMLISIEQLCLLDAVPASLRHTVQQINTAGRLKQQASLLDEASLYRVRGTVPGDQIHQIDRSVLPMTYLQIVGLLHGEAPSPSVVQIFERFLLLVQRCDDLSDWEDDLANGRLSPFLRQSLQAHGGLTVGSTRIQEHMYARGGAWTEWASLALELGELSVSCRAELPWAVGLNDRIRDFSKVVEDNAERLGRHFRGSV